MRGKELVVQRSFENEGIIQQVKRWIELSRLTRMESAKAMKTLMNRWMQIRLFASRVFHETLAKLLVLGAMQALPRAREEAINIGGGHVAGDLDDLAEDRLNNRHFLEGS